MGQEIFAGSLCGSQKILLLAHYAGCAFAVRVAAFPKVLSGCALLSPSAFSSRKKVPSYEAVFASVPAEQMRFVNMISSAIFMHRAKILTMSAQPSLLCGGSDIGSDAKAG